MKKTKIDRTRLLAEKIVVCLLTTGSGSVGTRLAIKLEVPGEKDKELAGWCMGAAIDAVARVLRKELE